MNRDMLKDYLLSQKGAYEDYPFDEVTAVYKVGKKMFGLLSADAEILQVNLKCDPDDALFLRDHHSAVVPGYHMNKKHWNTVMIDGSLSDECIKDLVDKSYELVLKSMTKKERMSYM